MNKPALLILDVFSGQMTAPVTEKLAQNFIKYVKVPANMTNLFQPLDLTVNGSAKAFMKKKFTEWYSLEVTKQLDNGKSAEEIEVKLLLSKLKPPNASWLIDLYNHFTSQAGREVIANGWKAAGITDAIEKGSASLEPLDPFSQIDPLFQPDDEELFTRNPTYPTIEPSTNPDSDDDDEWIHDGDSADEDRNIFDIFDDEQ